ncbi:hypothetical protein HDU96_010924 [Phlyctochytrium bullatum]|nr:hypothetical protein HDU96_010924 [Phlyctochytrium bullatum]
MHTLASPALHSLPQHLAAAGGHKDTFRSITKLQDESSALRRTPSFQKLVDAKAASLISEYGADHVLDHVFSLKQQHHLSPDFAILVDILLRKGAHHTCSAHASVPFPSHHRVSHCPLYRLSTRTTAANDGDAAEEAVGLLVKAAVDHPNQVSVDPSHVHFCLRYALRNHRLSLLPRLAGFAGALQPQDAATVFARLRALGFADVLDVPALMREGAVITARELVTLWGLRPESDAELTAWVAAFDHMGEKEASARLLEPASFVHVAAVAQAADEAMIL